ncbi:MAG TPA: hypothetical protein HPQ04_09050 [Rhodospirillaceae bacterium]|nr:hypothetical protein [Rhodospirillaceae bacterium]
MNNGSTAYRLLHCLKTGKPHVVTRADLTRFTDRCSSGRGGRKAGKSAAPDLDRAMRRLAREKLVDRLGPGRWLVPTGEKPIMEVPRLWSNPGQDKPETVIAVTVANPTIADITRLILSYGSGRVGEVLDTMEDDREIHAASANLARRMINNSIAGIRAAAERHVTQDM